MRPGLHSESESDAATVNAVIRLRDQLIADGHDLRSIGVAMTAIGAGALCGDVRQTRFPVPENGVAASGPQVDAAT
jgi:hypothetical protein